MGGSDSLLCKQWHGGGTAWSHSTGQWLTWGQYPATCTHTRSHLTKELSLWQGLSFPIMSCCVTAKSHKYQQQENVSIFDLTEDIWKEESNQSNHVMHYRVYPTSSLKHNRWLQNKKLKLATKADAKLFRVWPDMLQDVCSNLCEERAWEESWEMYLQRG